jgi:hypothetical protein
VPQRPSPDTWLASPDSGNWLVDLVFKCFYFSMRLLTRWRNSWTVSLAGFALIMIGVLCLCLSALVAATASWWQGTLDAFGVGFVVGGVVDVMAIFGLTSVLSRQAERGTRANQQAQAILAQEHEPHTSDLYKQYLQARELLDDNWGVLDREVRDRLLKFIEEANDALTDHETPELPPHFLYYDHPSDK